MKVSIVVFQEPTIGDLTKSKCEHFLLR